VGVAIIINNTLLYYHCLVYQTNYCIICIGLTAATKELFYTMATENSQEVQDGETSPEGRLETTIRMKIGN